MAAIRPLVSGALTAHGASLAARARPPLRSSRCRCECPHSATRYRDADDIVGAGSSNLGAFPTAESNCLNPVTGGSFNGLFTFTFAGGRTLFGTAAGTVALPPVNGTTTNVFEYLITGGTGGYANAAGRLRVDGVARFNPAGTTSKTFTYNGAFSIVPEPSAMLVLGAGLASVAVAARRRPPAAVRP